MKDKRQNITDKNNSVKVNLKKLTKEKKVRVYNWREEHIDT